MFTSFDKALVAVVVAGVLALLGRWGIVDTMTVGDAVPLLIASVLTWLIPNKKSI